MIKAHNQRQPRVCQGDIYQEIEMVERITERDGMIEVSKIIYPYVIVLTQDCDLEQEYRFRWAEQTTKKSQDKWLVSVLVAPLYNAEHVYTGEHLSELGIQMQLIKKDSTQGGYLRTNQLARYHHLTFPDNISIVPSVIDFKHYFSVNSEYLKNIQSTNYICTVGELYREDISQRFAAFLARIGLPEPNEN